MVRELRNELGTPQGTVRRVAEQLGYGVESVRQWVRQAEIDAGEQPGASTMRTDIAFDADDRVSTATSMPCRRVTDCWRTAAPFGPGGATAVVKDAWGVQ